MAIASDIFHGLPGLRAFRRPAASGYMSVGRRKQAFDVVTWEVQGIASNPRSAWTCETHTVLTGIPANILLQYKHKRYALKTCFYNTQYRLRPSSTIMQTDLINDSRTSNMQPLVTFVSFSCKHSSTHAHTQPQQQPSTAPALDSQMAEQQRQQPSPVA